MVKNHARVLSWLWLGVAAIIVISNGRSDIWAAAALIMSTVWSAAAWVATATQGAPGLPGLPGPPGPQGATGSQGPAAQ